MSYVGELGWELHLPVENAVDVYQALFRAGQPFGIANAGYRALESLRLEKGFRAWGSDLTPDATPLEAGLGFAVKLSSELDFIGKSALLAQKTGRLTKKLRMFATDQSDTPLIGRETIYRNGERVGWLTSAGYGYTEKQYLGLGYVRNPNGIDSNWLEAGNYELEVATRRIPARLCGNS